MHRQHVVSIRPGISFCRGKTATRHARTSLSRIHCFIRLLTPRRKDESNRRLTAKAELLVSVLATATTDHDRKIWFRVYTRTGQSNSSSVHLSNGRFNYSNGRVDFVWIRRTANSSERSYIHHYSTRIHGI